MGDSRPDILLKTARERFGSGDPHGAIILLSELVKTGQAYADAHNLLGLALALVSRREEAVAEFDEALRLNPRYVDAHLNRAITLSDLGRTDDASDAFKLAQTLGAIDHTGFASPIASRLANMHADLADAYMEAGGRKEAIAQLEAAATLRPEFSDLRYRLARLYMEEGRVERARLELEGIVAVRPQFIDAWVSLGMARYLMKDHGQARAAWEEGRRMAPKDARVTACLSLLDRISQ